MPIVFKQAARHSGRYIHKRHRRGDGLQICHWPIRVHFAYLAFFAVKNRSFNRTECPPFCDLCGVAVRKHSAVKNSVPAVYTLFCKFANISIPIDPFSGLVYTFTSYTEKMCGDRSRAINPAIHESKNSKSQFLCALRDRYPCSFRVFGIFRGKKHSSRSRLC
jgi:hypothetical protein